MARGHAVRAMVGCSVRAQPCVWPRPGGRQCRLRTFVIGAVARPCACAVVVWHSGMPDDLGLPVSSDACRQEGPGWGYSMLPCLRVRQGHKMPLDSSGQRQAWCCVSADNRRVRTTQCATIHPLPESTQAATRRWPAAAASRRFDRLL
jgi:hypothetical protein